MVDLSTEVITGRVCFDDVNIWKDKAINVDNFEYSVCLLIPKSDGKTLSDIRKAIENAKKIGINILDNKLNLNIESPLKDGLEKSKDEIYKGCYFINAININQPVILDKFNKPINNKEEFYNGCYGYASINFYAFNDNVNKGITCKINTIIKTDDGDLQNNKLNDLVDMSCIEAIKLEGSGSFMV
ncbi:DUF2815 family protein [Candidatus Arthromitus sp. SFB-rat-Yit]|uniref:DUF2815 family protein n=1 Tax=Candidatus Arthromitus sp. SFB-rat-Yit TaxID=1041504 RepID=UPI000227A4DF|nr:DUF2815 family protein [Candidatus Arthromitus sp. SFB-rat-Yit]BAK80970.1 phage-associated protein [Candidatus Arthromitus sp. SFB-rat-Yit]